ncbi:MAG: hypothetical protein V1492_02955 [Candidatus Micrarchaeota archaeon]
MKIHQLKVFDCDKREMIREKIYADHGFKNGRLNMKAPLLERLYAVRNYAVEVGNTDAEARINALMKKNAPEAVKEKATDIEEAGKTRAKATLILGLGLGGTVLTVSGALLATGAGIPILSTIGLVAGAVLVGKVLMERKNILDKAAAYALDRCLIYVNELRSLRLEEQEKTERLEGAFRFFNARANLPEYDLSIRRLGFEHNALGPFEMYRK